MPPNSSSRRCNGNEDVRPQEPQSGNNTTPSVLPSILKAVELVVLAAVYSPISQLSLSPVYGSIPPSIHHQRLMMVAVTLTWATKNTAKRYVERYISLVKLLPLMAFAIPAIQFFLFPHSATLGPVYGPLIMEFLTYFPLIYLSIYAAAESLDCVDLSGYSERVQNALPGIASYFLFTATEQVADYAVKGNMGSSKLFTRAGLQFIVATFYAILSPKKYLLLVILLWMNVGMFYYHFTLQTGAADAAINSVLKPHGYALIARSESITGYLSVLDNKKDGFRVMRCDHSLLGGEWKSAPKDSKVKEPIYAVFAMLEAVRLVDTQSFATGHQRNALVIGLGIGTTPSALIAHGIKTTILEIDPVVHKFATEYFDLPKEHTSIIEDALSFVKQAQRINSGQHKYDYIIHDVFTGGAEPADLFTQEFLQGLHTLLKPNGVIAINYAGNLKLPSAALVVRTIRSVFPSCRLFREEEYDETDPSTLPGEDFTNLVFFCIKTSTSLATPFKFRDPVEADFLGSPARKYHLLPKYEVETGYFEENGEILTKRNINVLKEFQVESAVGHWYIMRRVMPAAVWEAW